MYQKEKKKRMEELKDMYDYPFTPMLSDRTRQISERIASEYVMHRMQVNYDSE